MDALVARAIHADGQRARRHALRPRTVSPDGRPRACAEVLRIQHLEVTFPTDEVAIVTFRAKQNVAGRGESRGARHVPQWPLNSRIHIAIPLTLCALGVGAAVGCTMDGGLPPVRGGFAGKAARGRGRMVSWASSKSAEHCLQDTAPRWRGPRRTGNRKKARGPYAGMGYGNEDLQLGGG